MWCVTGNYGNDNLAEVTVNAQGGDVSIKTIGREFIHT